jgi:magnesium-transporting ATPase (P-type)
MTQLADLATMAPSESSSEAPWHAAPAAEVRASLKTGPGGLSSGDAARRLQAHGPNELPAPPGPHPIRRFLAQFNNPLIYSSWRRRSRPH